MENRESAELLKSLDEITESLLNKIEETRIEKAILSLKNNDFSFESKSENNNKIIEKIIVRGVGGGLLGFGISYLTDGNKGFYSLMGGLLFATPLIVSLFSNKDNGIVLDKQANGELENYNNYKSEVLTTIRKVNEDIRKDWQEKLLQLTKDQRDRIKLMPWTEDQKVLATEQVLVFKSIIITDYHYTDDIEDLDIDERFVENINNLIGKWKESVSKIIIDTKNDQWQTYFSKIGYITN